MGATTVAERQVRNDLVTQWVVIKHLAANGVAGGGNTNNAINTRTLTDITENPSSVCSLSSNQFTLQPGNYGLISVVAPAYRVESNQLALYNVTDDTYDLYGPSHFFNDNDFISGEATLTGVIGTLVAAKTYEIRHYTSKGIGTEGFGIASSASSGFGSVFTTVTIAYLGA